MKRYSKLVLVLILGLSLVGCNTVGKMFPPNDAVLVYKLPYDRTFLKVVEAVDGRGNWVLTTTDMDKGSISIRDTNYSRLDDADLRVITFIVKRVDRNTTSVFIEPKSQQVYGGDKLLTAIRATLDRESKR